MIRFLSILTIATLAAHAQIVKVTLVLDTNTVAVGQTTTLRVFAQVNPEFGADSDQIFSWYLDFLNNNPNYATATFASIQKPASDKDPQTSSNGSVEGANLRSIYDTLMNRPRAGVLAPVELFNLPVVGVAIGRAAFKVQAGSTVPELFADFIVSPESGGEPLIGGDYTDAQVSLDVVRAPLEPVKMSITARRLVSGETESTIQFNVSPGANHYVEFKDALSATSWQTLPGSPHNLGTVVNRSAAPTRFYRVRRQ